LYILSYQDGKIYRIVGWWHRHKNIQVHNSQRWLLLEYKYYNKLQSATINQLFFGDDMAY
jgi:hypothetical protein